MKQIKPGDIVDFEDGTGIINCIDDGIISGEYLDGPHKGAYFALPAHLWKAEKVKPS